MTKLSPIIVAILLSLIVDYTAQDGCKEKNSICISSTECCSGMCYGKCISQCQPVNAACGKGTDVCCKGLQCEQSTKKCCRLPGQTTRTPSECCSLQWISNSNGCGGKCTSLCQPVNASCNQSNDVCCDGLQCNQSTKKCCRLSGQMAQMQSECCSQSWIKNSTGGSGGKCCSQHGSSCTANAICCSNLDSCSNPQWPNLCV
jgi:hypothetical protein